MVGDSAGSVGAALVEVGGAGAAALLGALWRASVGAVLLAVPVAAGCRLLPRLPASARFWLWWLVCAKLLVGLVTALVPAGSSPLPAVTVRLPAHQAAAAPAFFVARLAVRPGQTIRRASRVTERAVVHAGLAVGVVQKAAYRPLGTGTAPAGGTAAITAAAWNDGALPRASQTATMSHRGLGGYVPGWAAPLTAIVLALAWVGAVVVHLVRQLRGVGASRRLLRGATSANAATLHQAALLMRRLGMPARLAATIAVRCSPAVPAPLVAGLWRPMVVLPEPSALTNDEQPLALAHELAHVARWDLWLAAVPLLAETLFSFLPVALWAARECAACREEACDAAAIRATSPDQVPGYGRLLLKAALAASRDGDGWRRATGAAGALGIVAGTTRRGSRGFLLLKRRLAALQAMGARPMTAAWRRAGALLVALTVPGVLPMRLRAMREDAEFLRDAGRHPARVDATSAVRPGPATDEAILPQYHIVDLGTLGGTYSEASALNDQGLVVGSATVPRWRGRVSGYGHAFLLAPGTAGLRDLAGASPFRHSVAASVNGSGTVAATAFNSTRKPTAFVWSPDGAGGRRYLTSLPGFPYSQALGVDDNGVVVGAALRPRRDADGAMQARACIWDPDGATGATARGSGPLPVDLGTLGGRYSVALAAKAGVVVGKADTVDGATHAVAWRADRGELDDIGVLPGGRDSAATSVNRSGDIVGYSETATSPHRAFLFTQGRMEELVSPTETTGDRTPTSVAYGVNDSDLVVGAASYVPVAHASRVRPSRAVAWASIPGSDRHVFVDLTSRLTGASAWSLEAAHGVNDLGQIVGVGRIHGHRHAFLLMPEPSRPPRHHSPAGPFGGPDRVANRV